MIARVGAAKSNIFDCFGQVSLPSMEILGVDSPFEVIVKQASSFSIFLVIASDKCLCTLWAGVFNFPPLAERHGAGSLLRSPTNQNIHSSWRLAQNASGTT